MSEVAAAAVAATVFVAQCCRCCCDCYFVTDCNGPFSSSRQSLLIVIDIYILFIGIEYSDWSPVACHRLWYIAYCI